VAAVAIFIAFCALNYRVYDGFFQDDELDTLSWAPLLGWHNYVPALLKPTLDVANFRPTGHFYFTLAGKAFGLDYPPYVTPILAIHLFNVILLWLVLRKLRIPVWSAMAGVAFFALSATAMDAYWKPMYVFDLLCATFCLTSLLLWMHGRWVLSFVAFWLAYKAKELAVMLPLVLLAYEFLPGKKRWLPLLPFFAASLSFGLQGIFLNPNNDNDYTFRFTFAALQKTVPFYARRLLFLPFSGFLLLPLAFVRDRRVWFGLASMGCFLFTLLFLPGRLFEAYTYLPLAGAVIAVAAAASTVNPRRLALAILIWLPWNYRQLHREQRSQLDRDDEAFAFVDQLDRWATKNPGVKTLIYNAPPGVYHHWGVTGAWKIVHHGGGLKALFIGWPEAAEVRADETFANATWDAARRTLTIQIESPKRTN
jgi:hypothetical protein